MVGLVVWLLYKWIGKGDFRDEAMRFIGMTK